MELKDKKTLGEWLEKAIDEVCMTWEDAKICFVVLVVHCLWFIETWWEERKPEKNKRGE